MGAGAVEVILPWPKMPLPPEMPPEAGGNMETLWLLPSAPLQSSTREPGKGRSLQYRAGQRRARNGAEKRDQFWPIAQGPATTMWQSQVCKQGALESTSLGGATGEMRGGQNSRWKK